MPHEFQRRILIVDEDAALLAATTAALSREGYEVMTATDGSRHVRLFAADCRTCSFLT